LTLGTLPQTEGYRALQCPGRRGELQAESRAGQCAGLPGGWAGLWPRLQPAALL